MNTSLTYRRRSQIVLFALPIALVLTAFGCRAKNNNANTAAANSNRVATTNTTVSAPVTLNVTGGPEAPRRSATEQELARLASAFAERYGSYSNQTNYENLEALYVFMTPALQDATRAFVAAEREKQRDTSIYYGITARGLSVKTASLDEGGGNASFLVSTFRKETIGSGGNVKTFQEELVVDMRKDGDAWRVDQAIWQGRR